VVTAQNPAAAPAVVAGAAGDVAVGDDVTGAGGLLLERLMGVVRPEFRAEVFLPPRGRSVFFYGQCRLPSCATAIHRPRLGLCKAHHTWWLADGRPPVETWLPGADQRLIQSCTDVAACAIFGCNRAARRAQLCIRHSNAWAHLGCPPWEQWVAATRYVLACPAERDCCYPRCPRWTDGPDNPLCSRHQRRWRAAGKPEVNSWVAALPFRHDPRVDLRGLGRRVRLEFQFGLQCRFDEGTKITNVVTLVQAASMIRAAGVDSLLDLDDEAWRAATSKGRPGDQGPRSFLLDTCFHLRGLLIEDPWTDQYPREVWDLRVLRLDRGVRYLRFDQITQGWLREAVKRWCRWRLSRGLAPSTVNHDRNACRILSEHLTRVGGHIGGGDAPPAALTRSVLESWFARLRIDYPDPTTRAHIIGSVATLLHDLQRHGWEPDLPRDARIYPDDAPRRGPGKPRWVAEHLMRQLEAPASLAAFPSPDGAVLLQIIISCGLRLGDARRLPWDCIVRDAAHAPYLAWINYKIRERVAFFPISDQLATTITEQQQRTRARFPTSPWLFTASQKNFNGSRPMTATAWRRQLDQWLHEIKLTDSNGTPARLTPHQFRHTLATRLINADVPQHVVQQLLDHMSPEMTNRYARLHQQTLRRHWETATKINAEGQEVTIAPEHPLADAAWMRISMVRAKVTLPNGYCGAPVQTDCEYANPCLDCRFFITTRDFLDQHRRQRAETRRLIDDAEQTGLSRVAEKNRRTATKLDTIIGALEHADPGQIVVGGRTEDAAKDVDAAG
jgi:integrase